MTVVKSFTNVDPELKISVPTDVSGTEIPYSLECDVQEFVDAVCPTLSKHPRLIKTYW